MNKQSKTTKCLRKPVVSKPLISIAFNENQFIICYIKLCFDEKTIICVNSKSPLNNHIKSYGYANDNKYRQKL